MNIGDKDQTQAALKDWAETVWMYYRYLVDVGFRASEAMQLTLSWQTAMIHKNVGKTE